MDVSNLYKDINDSRNIGMSLSMARIWNEMFQSFNDFNKATYNIENLNSKRLDLQNVREYYKNSIKSVNDIDSVVKSLVNELEKKKNIPTLSRSLVAQG